MEIIKFVQSFHNPFLDKIFQLITIMGEQYLLILFTGIILWCINKKIGEELVLVLITTGIVNGFIKSLVKSPRPIGTPGIRSLRVHTATGTSFPSGHTQATTALWTTIMEESKKKWIYILGISIIILVAISRLYLGVHWPKDVIGGAIIGSLWAITVSKLFNYGKEKNKPYVLLFLIIPVCILTLFFRDKNLVKASGALLGFYISFLLEEKYVKYNPKATFLKQILKLIIGGSIVLGIEMVFKKLLPNILLVTFIKYFIMSIWVVLGAPYLFLKLNLSYNK